MKIVNLETFRALPIGTVFSKYRPQIFDNPMVKDRTTEHDFYYQDLVGNIENIGDFDLFDKCDQMEQDEDINMPLDFDTITRDGLYEKEQLFAVYSEEDVEQLILRLQKALSDYRKGIKDET